MNISSWLVRKRSRCLMLVRNRAGEVLHDRPAGVRAELVAAGVVELLHGPDQRHVAVADQLEEVVRRADVPLGDRDHQPQVGADDLVLDRHGLVVQPLDLVHHAALGAAPDRAARAACAALCFR